MRLRLAVGVATVVALLGGCAGVPANGAVHVARPRLAATGTVAEPITRILPPGPVPGAQAPAVALSFINALASSDGSYAVAREFLTRAAATAWRPGAAAVVYADNSLSVTLRGTVAVVGGQAVGTLDAGGAFRLAEQPFQVTLPLRRDRGQWRVAAPPHVLALSLGDVERTYLPVDLYYLDPSGQVLVPDRVYLSATDTDVATAVVRRLLAGPSSWLAPAAHSAFPAGTRLTGAVTVDNGVATVPMSAALAGADAQARQSLSAQLVWTLKQLAGVSGVRLLAGGSPLRVTGEGTVQSTADWASYTPSVLGPQATVYFSDGGVIQQLDPATGRHTPVAGLAGYQLHDPAAGLARYAALGTVRGQETLFELVLGRPVLQLAHAAALTPPTFDVRQRLWTVATESNGAQRVLVYDAAGRPVPVAVTGLLGAGPLDALVPSRDGCRVVVIVGPTGARRLLLGRVVPTAGGGLTLSGFRPVLSHAYADVSAVAWVDADRVLALVTSPGGGQTSAFPIVVGIDGWPAARASVLTAGLPAAPITEVAAAPGGHQLLLSVAGQVWASATGSWQPIATGSDPTFGP